MEQQAMSDEQLLEMAYASPDRMAYDPTTRTLAVAGTSSWNDVLVDATVPFGNLIEHTDRYNSAEAAYLRYRPRTTIGHSLAGEIIAHIAARFPNHNAEFRLYGAPRLTWVEVDNRITSFRRIGDPVAMLDNAAITIVPDRPNVHSYRGYGNRSTRSVPYDQQRLEDVI